MRSKLSLLSGEYTLGEVSDINCGGEVVKSIPQTLMGNKQVEMECLRITVLSTSQLNQMIRLIWLITWVKVNEEVTIRLHLVALRDVVEWRVLGIEDGVLGTKEG